MCSWALLTVAGGFPQAGESAASAVFRVYASAGLVSGSYQLGCSMCMPILCSVVCLIRLVRQLVGVLNSKATTMYFLIWKLAITPRADDCMT